MRASEPGGQSSPAAPRSMSSISSIGSSSCIGSAQQQHRPRAKLLQLKTGDLVQAQTFQPVHRAAPAKSAEGHQVLEQETVKKPAQPAEHTGRRTIVLHEASEWT